MYCISDNRFIIYANLFHFLSLPRYRYILFYNKLFNNRGHRFICSR